MDEEATHLLFQELPNPQLSANEGGSYIKSFLREKLPVSDQKDVDRDVKWCFMLDKRPEDKKRKPQKRKRKTYLSRNERLSLNLLKLPQDGWNYKSLATMRKMWKTYMRENLELVKVPNHTDADYQSLNSLLAKSEYIGAEIKVVRSTCPSVVDISGTVVLETKNTFQIVTRDSKLKTILKQNSVFEIGLDNIRFTIFGKLLLTKPADRSVRKIKSLIVPDL